MRRMLARIVVVGCACVTLAMCVLAWLARDSVMTVWWRGELAVDRDHSGTAPFVSVQANFNGAVLTIGSVWQDVEIDPPAAKWGANHVRLSGPLTTPTALMPWEWQGIYFWDHNVRGPGTAARGKVVLLPWWLLIAAPLVPPAVIGIRRVRRLKRENRIRRGLCVSCGYDLRSSPRRCPECGTPSPTSVGPAQNPRL